MHWWWTAVFIIYACDKLELYERDTAVHPERLLYTMWHDILQGSALSNTEHRSACSKAQSDMNDNTNPEYIIMTS